MQVTDAMVAKACSAYGLNDPTEMHKGVMRAALTAALGAMWRPISEAEPNRTYLLGWRDWRDDRWCMEVAPAVHGQRYETGYSNVSHHGSATHFMPLPSPPSKEGE